MKKSDDSRGTPPPAFLLAQVGAHGASAFGKRLAAIGLMPPDAGILGLLSKSPGISQQDLAVRLNIHASRLVAIIDGMVERRLAERHRSSADRRVYSLQLTDHGRASLAAIGLASREHNEALCAALSGEERTVLAELLQRVADEQGLSRGVHPGYNRMGKPARQSKGEEKV